MSASTERKNRAAAREAGTDKKMLAQQEAERKAAKSRLRWTIGTIVVVILVIAIILFNPNVQYSFKYKTQSALTIGDRSYSAAELNYSYCNQYSSFLSQYGSYAYLFGLDTSQGVSSLGSQECSMLGEGMTWRDYFLQQAESELVQVCALTKYAEDNGIKLDDADLAAIEKDLDSLKALAKSYGYPNANTFLSSQYGRGVNLRLVREMTKESTLASKALQVYSDSLEYSPEQLEEYYASLEGSRDSFDFAVYTVDAALVPAEGENAGQDAPNEQTLLEARSTAEAIEMSYKDDYDNTDYVDRLDAAVESEFDTGRSTLREGVSGSSLGDLSSWLTDGARKAGDVGVVAASDGSGYSVVVFLAREDNHYPTVSVRHILIKAKASEDGTYSDEAKQAALNRINEIKAEYEAGDKSEKSFAALAEKYSEDDGSKTNGGLYENIYRGVMVPEFEDFCFGGHDHGDVAVVYGEAAGSYAGYHLVYFVGEGDLYSNLIARSALVNTADSEFLASLIEGVEPVLGKGAEFVG